MKIKKINNTMYKILLSILFIIVLGVTLMSIFKIYEPIEDLNPFIIILGTVICILFFISIKKLFNKIDESKSNIIAIIMCIFFLIGLIIFGVNMLSVPKTDLIHIEQEVETMMHNGGKFENEEYFSMYTNQTPVTILIYYIYSLGSFLGIKNLRAFGTIFNAIFITITAFFTYLSVKKISNHKIALSTLLFFVLNPIFYLYVSYFYTDTICLPFAAIAVYLYLIGIKNEQRWKKITALGGSGIVFALGFEIRVVVSFLLIAIIIELILKNKIKKALLDSGILIIGFIIGIMSYKLIASNFNVMNNKKYEFPITHWIMMGVNTKTHGGWNHKDYYHTRNIIGYEEKKQDNINVMKNRISKMSIKDAIYLLIGKIDKNWSNGDYEYLPKLTNVEKINVIYEYTSGNNKIYIDYLCQIFKTSIMLTLLVSIGIKLKNGNIDEDDAFIYISLFGAFLFYMLWEVRPRYSLSFLPWMFLVFGTGLQKIENILDLDKITIFNKNINFRIFKKVLINLTAVITVGLIVTGFYPTTIAKNEYKDKVIIQPYKNSLITDLKKIGNKKIQQTYITDKPFNQIGIEFKNKKKQKTETHYELKLFDEKNNTLYSKKFSSENVKHRKYKIFNFKTIKPVENEKYTIEITSNDATDKNSIGISGFSRKDYDVYKDGQLTINDTNINGDLKFKVVYKNKRSFVDKKTYIIISLCIIIIDAVTYRIIMLPRKKGEDI